MDGPYEHPRRVFVLLRLVSINRFRYSFELFTMKGKSFAHKIPSVFLSKHFIIFNIFAKFTLKYPPKYCDAFSISSD